MTPSTSSLKSCLSNSISILAVLLQDWDIRTKTGYNMSCIETISLAMCYWVRISTHILAVSEIDHKKLEKTIMMGVTLGRSRGSLQRSQKFIDLEFSYLKVLSGKKISKFYRMKISS